MTRKPTEDLRAHSEPLGHVSLRSSTAWLDDLEKAIDVDYEILDHLRTSRAREGFALGEEAMYDRRMYSLDYLKSQIFSKFVRLEKAGANERRSKAIEKWLLMERRNEKSNVRLFAVPARICGMETDDILAKASQFIREVIGTTPPRDILFGAFSGGASTSQKRGPGNIAAKFGDKADVTTDAWGVFKETLETSEAWLSIGWNGVSNPRKVPGNVLFTVPKNSKIDRVAAKEPDLNMFAQKGIGNFFRTQLLKQGVNLNDQTDNQRLAEQGSRERIYATVDLSSASDSISTSLVLRLLPVDWFDVLDRVRSKSTTIDGVEHELNMFSSMGNGFTFELETLIFWSLCRSVAYLKKIRGRINVYGDDIIVPVKMYPMLDRLFSYFGFILNREKSFGKGDFRESCGKHYYKGCDVSPFFIRGPITHVSGMILALNNLTAWLRRNTLPSDWDLFDPWDFGGYDFPDFPALNEVWEKGRSLVDRRFRGGSADWIGSNCVLVSSDKPKSVIRNAVREVEIPQDGAYLHWLHLRFEEPCWPGDGTFIGPFIRIVGKPSIWDVKGAQFMHLTLREPLITSRDVVTLESAWVIRPYRDVMYGDDLRL